MVALSPRAISALLSQVGLTAAAARTTLVAIALAESGGQVDRAVGSRRGLWMISDAHGFDRRMMTTDGAYAAAKALIVSGYGVDFSPWPSWSDGRYLTHLNAARQAEAQAAAVSGSILDEQGSYSVVGSGVKVTQVEHGGSQSTPDPAAGQGAPLAAAMQTARPLTGLRVSGTELTSDIAALAIGEVTYAAGMAEIPNLKFTIADPQGDLLWFQRNLWVKGARVQYLDLDLRIDEIEFEPGGHTTGQLQITAIDGLVHALQQLRGTRVASNISPTSFIRREVQLAGFNPDLYFLGENLPTQTEIARDVPDSSGSAGSGSGSDVPSAWTTILRLAKEQGRRAFISGRKLILGSAAFAADWAAPGSVRIGWHNSPEGERWLTLPTAKQTSSGSGTGTTEVTGRVPLNRAMYFRPGAAVIVHNTPSVAAGDRRMVCASIAHSLGTDVDGAEIVLTDPVDPTPEKTQADAK